MVMKIEISVDRMIRYCTAEKCTLIKIAWHYYVVVIFMAFLYIVTYWYGALPAHFADEVQSLCVIAHYHNSLSSLQSTQSLKENTSLAWNKE